MTNFLVLKHVYSKIIVLILLIQPHHASNRPILKCSDKRITCLSDVTYKFCFNTTSSHIMYGRIKRCPKYTVCREDEGHRPCILQEITNKTIMLPSFTNIQSTPIPLPSKVIGNNGNINTHTPARIIVKTSSISTSHAVSLNKHMSKSTLAPKIRVTKNSSVKPSTASVSTKVKKKTNKPNKLKFNNKRKKDKLVNNIIRYLKRFKNKSPLKKATKIPKYPSNIKRITKFPLKPTTKKPVVKISNKPSKKPTKKKKHGIASLTIRKNGTKRPTSVRKPSKNTIILSVKQKTPRTTPLTTSITTETSTFLHTTKSPSLVTVPTSKTIATTASATPILVQTTSTKTTSVTTSTTEKPIFVQTTLKATTVDVNVNVKDNTTEISLTSINNVGEHCNCSGILLNNNSYTGPPFPCEILENMFKLHATVPTTTISTVPTTPTTTTCKLPAKYPGEQCYEYYECMKVMWWHQMFTKNCKNEESFNVTLLTCQPDKNCTHG